MPKIFARKPKEAAPHIISKRRCRLGYRRMGKINLYESENGGNIGITEYEEWLKKK